jgi:hypothetical protein
MCMTSWAVNTCTVVVFAPHRDACVALLTSLGGSGAQVYTHAEEATFRDTRDHIVILIDALHANAGAVAADWFAAHGPFHWLLRRGLPRDRIAVAVLDPQSWCVDMDDAANVWFQTSCAKLTRVRLSRAAAPPVLHVSASPTRSVKCVAAAVFSFAFVAGAAALVMSAVLA